MRSHYCEFETTDKKRKAGESVKQDEAEDDEEVERKQAKMCDVFDLMGYSMNPGTGNR